MSLKALQKAIELSGGYSALARKLGISKQAVWQWQKVPDDRVADVEKATGRRVSRAELRPDLFGGAAASRAASARPARPTKAKGTARKARAGAAKKKKAGAGRKAVGRR